MTGPTTPSPSERPAAALGRGGRMSRRRKLGAVPRPLRGEDLELVSCKLGVTAARLTAWRDEFLAAGERDDRPQRRPGPAGGHTDDELAAAIRRALADGPFRGEGYRKLCARPRLEGIRTSKRRVLRGLAGVRARTGGQRLRRAARPHAQGESVVSPVLRDRRGAVPSAARLPAVPPRNLDRRAPRPPHPGSGPRRPARGPGDPGVGVNMVVSNPWTDKTPVAVAPAGSVALGGCGRVAGPLGPGQAARPRTRWSAPERRSRIERRPVCCDHRHATVPELPERACGVPLGSYLRSDSRRQPLPAAGEWRRARSGPSRASSLRARSRRRAPEAPECHLPPSNETASR
jgi:hypothetical protein